MTKESLGIQYCQHTLKMMMMMMMIYKMRDTHSLNNTTVNQKWYNILERVYHAVYAYNTSKVLTVAGYIVVVGALACCTLFHSVNDLMFVVVCFVGFYGISTFVGYLMPNPFICKESVLFQTTQFSMSTQFNYQKHFYFKLFKQL